jgi:hypothetical protein
MTLKRISSSSWTMLMLGKTMQNVRNQMNLHLTTDPKNAIKRFSKCSFKNNTYANGLYVIETHKAKIIYNKPVYVGCAVLNLSKLKLLATQIHLYMR